MSITLYKKEQILKDLLGQSSSSKPCWMGLSYTIPNPLDGSNFSEPWSLTSIKDTQIIESKTGYHRCLLGDINSSLVPKMTVINNIAYNTAMLYFGTALCDFPGNDTGGLQYFGLFNTSEGGAPYLVGKLNTNLLIYQGESPVIPQSSNQLKSNLKIILDDSLLSNITFNPGEGTINGSPITIETSMGSKYILPTTEDLNWRLKDNYLFIGWTLSELPDNALLAGTELSISAYTYILQATYLIQN